MAGNWNPNSPRALGLEWRGFYAWHDKATKSPLKAMKLRSTVAETIDRAHVGIAALTNTASPAFRLLEVYPEADILAGSTSIDRFVPNAHGSLGIGNWRNQAGSATTIYTSIDEGVSYPPVGGDYIRTIVGGAQTAASFNMSSGGFGLGRRVGRLRVRFVGASFGWRTIRFRLHHVPSGVNYVPPGADRNFHIYGILQEIDLGEINPVTLLPWSPLDVRGFGSAANVWQLRLYSVGSATNPAIVYNLELEVQYRTTENRVAVATFQRPPGASGGQGVDVTISRHIWTDQLVHLDVATGAWLVNWDKPASGDFVFVWRGAADTLVGGTEPRAQDIFWQFIAGVDRDGPMPSPIPGQAAGPVVFGAASTRMAGGILSAGPFTEPLAGVLMLETTVGSTISNDSQPYLINYPGGSATEVDGRVDDIWDQSQAMVADATETYVGVRFVVKPPADGKGVLRVTIHSWDGIDTLLADPQVGGVLDIDAAELLATPALQGLPGWREVRGFLSSPAALTAGNDYYVKLSKLSGTAGSVWKLQALDSTTIVGGGSASFQGNNNGFLINDDRATDGGVSRTEHELGLQLLEQPDPPADLVAQELVQQVSSQFGDCAPIAMAYTRLAWESPGTYVDFQQWDIDRREPDGTWVPIGTSMEESLSDFSDYEAVRDRFLKHRVRARMQSGALSEWVETPGSTPASEGPHVLFTSNARPDLNVGLGHEPEVSYSFPDHDNDELVRLSGVAYQAAFIDPTNRGVTGAYKLIVNFKTPPTDGSGNAIGGEAMFLPLRRMARSGFDADRLVPYVCVLDYEGNRRLAYIELSGGTRVQPGHRYHVNVQVVPLTDTPAVVERSALASSALLLDGTGDYLTTADHADYDITGDIEFRWEVQPQRGFTGSAQTVMSKWETTGDQRSYMVQHSAVVAGRPRVIWSPNGTVASQVIMDATADPPWPADGRLAFKFDLDVNVGGTQKTGRFWWAERHGGPYTQLGTSITTAGITSIHSGTAPYRVGARGDGATEPFAGLIFEADLYAGITPAATVRSDLNLRLLDAGTPPLEDRQGHAFTYQGDAQIVVVEP